MAECELLATFRTLGCDVDGITAEGVNWMWDVEATKPFLDWFVNNVGSSNVLSPGEIEEYSQWCQEGNELSGEELDRALQENGVLLDMSNLDIDSSDIDLVQEDIRILSHQKDVLEDLTSYISGELQEAEENAVKADKDLRKTQLEMHKEGQELMKLHVKGKSALKNFYQSLGKLTSTLLDYQNPDSQLCFLSQMPLDKFIAQCEHFDQHVHLFMKRQFEKELKAAGLDHTMFNLMNERSSIHSQNSNPDLSIDGSLKISPNRLWQAGLDKISHKAELAGLTAALDWLCEFNHDLNHQQLSFLQIRLDVISMQEEVNRLTEDVDALRNIGAADAVEQLVLQQILKVAENVAEQKVKRRKYRLEKLCHIRSLLDSRCSLVDLVVMLLNREAQCIKLAVEFVGESTGFLKEECSKHYDTMTVLQQIDKSYKLWKNAAPTSQFPFLAALQRLLGSISSHTGVPASLELQSTLESETKKLESAIMKIAFKQKLDEQLDSLHELVSQLNCGITRKPVLLKFELSAFLHCVRQNIFSARSDIETLYHNYSTKKHTLEKTPLLQNSRLLWAWFLVAPNCLEEAMSLAQREADIRKA